MKFKTMKPYGVTLPLLLPLLLGGITNATAAEGDAYEWPTYSPTCYYNFSDEGITYETPTRDLEGDCYRQAAGHKSKDYWTFVWGANRLTNEATDVAIDNLLNYFNQEFDYITNEMGWPRDRCVQDGYRSRVFLYGSMDCTGSNDPTEKGGWQTQIDGYPCVNASHYPVYSFDPSCPYADRIDQMNAMIHEGVHCILTGMASHVHWFQESGNTWLQQEMTCRRSSADPQDPNAYSGMGFLNGATIICSHMPIECYSGWLTDGTFGGPGAEGVAGNPHCNWRTTLGGSQYSNLFPTFLGVWMSVGAVPWLWKNTVYPAYLLETMGKQIGDAQIRRLIMEFRAKLAMLDMQGWSEEMRRLLNNNFGGTLGCEAINWGDGWYCDDNVYQWYATPYEKVTVNGNIATPEEETTPGWSGANIVPLKVSGNTVRVKLNPIGENMSIQLCYRATDGTPVYSYPVMGAGTAVLRLDKAPQDDMVFAVVCNTDYAFTEARRTTHYKYTLEFVEGVQGAGSERTKYYNNFKLGYDWFASCNNCSNDPVIVQIDTLKTMTYDVELPISSEYEPTVVDLNADEIANAFGMDKAQLIAANYAFYGLNPNNSFYKTSTANDPGHWFTNSGNVCNYDATNSTIFSELTRETMKVNIGHFPERVKEGDKYTIKQTFMMDNKCVNLVFNVKITQPKGSYVPNIASDARTEKMTLYHDQGEIVVRYNVPFNTRVKLSLYTATGGLITHLVNTDQQEGDYVYAFSPDNMGLPQGTYLVKYTYPSHSETKVAFGR